jgi:hypothetical protein
VLLINFSFLQSGLLLDYQASIKGNYWTGVAKVPESYFPRNVTKVNAYAIHGEKDARQYQAAYPVPYEKYSNADL